MNAVRNASQPDSTDDEGRAYWDSSVFDVEADPKGREAYGRITVRTGSGHFGLTADDAAELGAALIAAAEFVGSAS
jgi:hypothetical protein